MAVEREATVGWDGNLMEGNGTLRVASGAFDDAGVTWPRRTGEPEGHTSPEELIAAAQAACYAMSLAHTLAQAGHQPEHLDVSAAVGFQPGEGITGVRVNARARVPGLDAQQFEEAAKTAKANCPVTNALSVDVSLEASLAG